jgi:hypothetical protein
MDRRQFLKMTGLAGLAVMAPAAMRGGVRESHADSSTYGGPYWVTLHAGGGWDPTYLCDPKGGTKDDKKSINQLFTPDQIKSAGSISYAPVNYSSTKGKDTVEVYSNERFFGDHHDRLMVINGLDTTTNNHDTGTRAIWSGQSAEGYPSFAALVAAAATQSMALPMAFLSSGGYDATSGLVALTRAGDIGSLRRLAYPDRVNPDDDNNLKTFHSPDTAARIAKAQSERLKAMHDAQRLPSLQYATNALYTARQGNGGLNLLAQAFKGVPTLELDKGPKYLEDLQGVGGLNDLEGLLRQIQLATLAFQSGVAVSANLSIGGFDTHGQHDNNQVPQLMKLIRAVDYLYKIAGDLGIADKLYVLVGSDFGRTPYYNEGNGKDHWNITSMLLSGPGITGNRVVGTSDAGFKSVKVDPKTLAPSDSGLRIQPNHVHKALRKLAKLDDAGPAKGFGLAGEDLPLFG